MRLACHANGSYELQVRHALSELSCLIETSLNVLVFLAADV